MASQAISTTLTLSLLLLLLTLGAGQVNPGSFDISAEEGWDKFVKDAAKATGGTPINMDEFITRVNNNMNKTGVEEPDPELLHDLKNFNGRDGGSTVSNPFASEMSSDPPAAVNNLTKAKMIGSTNGGSLAPESNAALNGAMPVQAAGGLLLLLLPAVFAAYFVL